MAISCSKTKRCPKGSVKAKNLYAIASCSGQNACMSKAFQKALKAATKNYKEELSKVRRRIESAKGAGTRKFSEMRLKELQKEWRDPAKRYALIQEQME